MNDLRYRHISFLSDYGESDEFAGVCRGVMLGIAPGVTVIDITHAVTPFRIEEGAILLARAVPYLPRSVHLAVVDPGVGSDRRAVAIETLDGSCLVGPDNGLLMPAAEKLGGIAECRVLENPRYMLAERSDTFHGRDIFAPAAAHIALGVPLMDFGPGADLHSLVPLLLPEPKQEGGTLLAVVLHCDHFGNLELNLGASDLAKLGISFGENVRVEIEDRGDSVLFGRTFSAVAAGEPILFQDSHKSIALAINSASAADHFSAGPGTQVTLSRTE